MTGLAIIFFIVMMAIAIITFKFLAVSLKFAFRAIILLFFLIIGIVGTIVIAGLSPL